MSEGLSSQLYAAETANFLRMFTSHDPAKPLDEQFAEVTAELKKVFEAQSKKLRTGELSELERKYGLFHPVVIGDALIEKFGFSEADKKKLSEILEKTYPIDPTTGYYAKQCMPTIIGLAHLFAQETQDTPVCMVEGDFINMRGCNDYFKHNSTEGNAATDKLLHVIAGLVKEAFEAEGRVVQPVRAGGDETRLVVYGMEKDAIERILKEKVQPRIHLLAAEFGVHDVPHKKKGKLPGFGAAYACVDLNKETDPGRIGETIDNTLSARKTAIGLLRAGMFDAERIATKYYRPSLDHQGLKREDIEQRLQEAQRLIKAWAEDATQEWQRLTGQGGAYHKLSQQYEANNPRDFFEYHAQASESERSNKLAAIHISPGPKARNRIPFNDIEVTDLPNQGPQMHRVRAALQAFGFTAAAAQAREEDFIWQKGKRMLPGFQKIDPKRQRLQEMVVDLMDAFHAPDPSARCKPDTLMHHDGKRFIKRHGGARILHVEITSLSTLNHVSTELAEAVIREISKHIRETLIKHPSSDDPMVAAHMADYMFYEKNGKFKVFLPPDYKFMAVVERDLQKTLAGAIFNKSVQGFALETYANPHGRRNTEQASKIMQALDKRLSTIQGKGTKIARLPHTEGREIQVGIQCYGLGRIDAYEPVEKALERINADAETYFQRQPAQHR